MFCKFRSSGLLALGLFQLLPFRNPDTVGMSGLLPIRSLSFNPYATRFIVIEVIALLIYFAATLVFVDTPKRLRLLV